MKGHSEKFTFWPRYVLAYGYRELTRLRLSRIVSWQKRDRLEDGCTVVLGLCSMLPQVLMANLECLERAIWPEFKELIIAVDSKEGVLEQTYVDTVLDRYKKLNPRFVYYNEKQYQLAEKYKLPWVYCWLSWVVGMNESKTKHVLIHDYDALILSDVLQKRYQRFVEEKSVMQGVSWYWTHGIVESDRLAATFEAFVDMEWVRRFHPIRMINQVGTLHGRRVDFDILTEMQAHASEESQRGIYSVGAQDMAHPTQMIHQYTVFRKAPGSKNYSASLIMIPFFQYLSGYKDVLKKTIALVRANPSKVFELLGDGVLVNFELLLPVHVDEMMKLMVQTCLKLKMEPFKDLVDYGAAFYALSGVSEDKRWMNEFDISQREWVKKALAIQ